MRHALPLFPALLSAWEKGAIEPPRRIEETSRATGKLLPSPLQGEGRLPKRFCGRGAGEGRTPALGKVRRIRCSVLESSIPGLQGGANCRQGEALARRNNRG